MDRSKLGEKQRVSRKVAALQQINSAIRLFHAREFASAITLALAAEELLPQSEAPHLLKQLKERAPDIIRDLNLVRNWLKHLKSPDEIDLFEFEVVVALARGVTKFIAVYRQGTPEMEAFITWSRENGYLKVKPGAQSD